MEKEIEIHANDVKKEFRGKELNPFKNAINYFNEPEHLLEEVFTEISIIVQFPPPNTTELGIYFQTVNEKEDALVNFKKLLDVVELSNNKLYVFINKYDTSMNKVLKNETLLQALTSHHKNKSYSTKSRFESIESSFKQFFSRLKTTYDEGVAHVFLTEFLYNSFN
ncbi:hypothetical protein C1645_745917 [Glomus cerebriforme]|uniref:Uncharacterized protein n=1 Tax=Glomus cerebriforme TaxID=658196 RepID=A0A397S9N8_9GLOM|nr:hypothetical protein C1645_745917 [Glomus cerebriforme]